MYWLLTGTTLKGHVLTASFRDASDLSIFGSTCRWRARTAINHSARQEPGDHEDPEADEQIDVPVSHEMVILERYHT